MHFGFDEDAGELKILVLFAQPTWFLLFESSF